MLKQKILIAIFGAISATSLIGAITSTAVQSEYTIKIAFLGGPDDEDYDGSLVFKEHVESRTGGRVGVDIYPSGQFCGNERECIEGLQSGVLEVHMTTIGGTGNVFGPAQVLDLPYAFRDDRVAECVLDGPIADQLRKEVLSKGLNMRLMTISNTGGWRNFATVNKQIKNASDLQGIKIRTTPAQIQQELVHQLGANATAVAWSEVYTSMATGIIEGTKNGIQDVVSAKLHEHIKYIILDGHAYMGALWWYSEPAWKKLPDEFKPIVYDAFQHLKTVTRALPMRKQIEAYEEFTQSGGTIYVPSEEEKASFKAAASGMRVWFKERYGDEWLNRLDLAVETCEREIDKQFDEVNRAY